MVLFFSGRTSIHDSKRKIKQPKTVVGRRFFRTKSLQVPCNTPIIKFDLLRCLGKRVLPFISRDKKRASMSVEAAIALPVFVFFSVALLSPIRWLDNQRKAQTEAERICEELSLWAYAEEGNYITKEEIQEKDAEKEVVQYEWSYREKVPFFQIRGSGVEMKVAAQRRKWIGLDGKLREEREALEAGELEETMVYVGAGMGRYHLRRDCHYISNQYESLSSDEARTRKTSDGHQLKPCDTCKPDSADSGTVYVTAEGRHYHRSVSCPSMVSYVRRVPLREVAYLGACSYCASGTKD